MNIEIGQMMVTKIPQQVISNSWLSVPGWEHLTGTNGLCRDYIRASQDPAFDSATMKLPYRSYEIEKCLFPYEKHLEGVGLSPSDKWILTGARNLGNNLRIVGWDCRKGLLELNGENATSGREYCCLCKSENGKLFIDHVSFPDGIPDSDNLSWAVSGQELVWDGKPSSLDKIIPYTYDLRHIWKIPGGTVSNMGPRPYSGTKIEEMCDRFVSISNLLAGEVTRILLDFARREEYERENDYFHNAIGISEDGDSIIILQQHGSFETVTASLIHAGAYRAIELDQGGSCGVMMGGDSDFSPGRLMIASHYFRPRGLSLLILKLNESEITESSDLLYNKSYLSKISFDNVINSE
ncbi:MAG: hypothetical protein A2158_05140 [Chloroflexi bacterium RBG_13_46_14]|nr:MAG: hypothetical protein A2158_05140 [Chloroflexi bacterium RBG_13_46_14]